MTEESSGDDERGPEEAREEDGRQGGGPPSEEDVEAAREELEAVGSESDDATAESDDATAEDSDATTEDDGAVHAEDLVETPEERSVTGGPTDTDGVTGASDAATADPDAADASAVDATDATAPDDGYAPVGAPALLEGVAADAPDDESSAESDGAADDAGHAPGVPEDVRKYDRFKKVDGAQYDRVNEFLRDRTYVTAREWAIARLCSDFRTETGVEMTKIGENLPKLVPFMTDTYTPQAVNQARASFEDKIRTAGATFLYGAMCDFFTAEELDDVMYEATEVAKFLLEVEGVELSVEDELEAEDRISAVMREVRESSAELRHESCPECGAHLTGDD